MGALVADGYVPHVQQQLNARFAIGDALTEMIGFQREFKLFSRPHTLKSAFALLNIAPVGETDRDGFMKYLQSLMKTKADVDEKPSTLSGHDQILASLRENLESSRPLPVYFTWHPAESPRGIVHITSDKPFSFSTKTYLTISVPTIGADRPKAGARKK
ncbi:hypothetical protein [Bradyrhizobium sp.]|uniref:hypothetical protein n=1 Tax=Bradyrhizobium sp. TaxID=376 RepID=UPI0025B9A794|nr:hypothetical protein [Bradyrhizobium sp.]